jgi:Copper amine oxidase N-terminal domain
LNQLSIEVLTVLLVIGLGLSAVAAPLDAPSFGGTGPSVMTPATTARAKTEPTRPATFPTPSPRQIPILFNDHNVYAKPNELKQGRVLAALLLNGTILVPLRSMFEQMGAIVDYDPDSKTVDVSKAIADLKVTVGKPEVLINGETRPLDVPPEIYQGHVFVPIRVISEAMGAYVQWVPDRHIVVVRYVPPTPPPTPPPPPPTPTPVRSVAPYYDFFVEGDYIISPKVYDEFVPGSSSNNNNGGFSYRLHGALEFPIANLPWMVEVDYRQWNWQHTCGGAGDPQCFVTTIGGLGQTSVPTFVGRDYDFDARLGLRILKPRIYIVGTYMWRGNSYGYPKETGAGVGLEKLPDLDHVFSFYGSALYFFGVNGNYSSSPLACGNPTGSGCTFNMGYNILKYDIGISHTFEGFPLFMKVGFLGDRGWNYNAAPIGFSESGPYAGIGLKI